MTNMTTKEDKDLALNKALEAMKAHRGVTSPGVQLMYADLVISYIEKLKNMNSNDTE